MRTLVVGAGPAGLFTAIALARRGRVVTVLDRDAGPGRNGGWRRRGVMQFDHAHTFRGPVVDALEAEIPDALRQMRRAGATVAADADGAPVSLRIRRATFERVLRAVAAREPGVTLRPGSQVDAVLRDAAGRAVGVDVAGLHLSADLVIAASGRASRVVRGLLGPAETRPCGAAYVSRQYRLADGAQEGPVNSPVGLSLSPAGYFAVAFLHEDRTFSVTLAHDGTDERMRMLRHEPVYEAAVRAVPLLADWIDPDRARPLTPVLVGGRLDNTYRGQLGGDGRPVVPGLLAVGDSVCTTTPMAGRGVTLAFRQAQTLVQLVTADDVVAATVAFDRWCQAQIRPWFVDHVHCDADRLRRWGGGDVDLTRPLPSDLVVAAAAVDPALGAAVAGYERMTALPSSLDAVQERARAVYATGWRPPVAAGADRAELARLCVALRERRPVAVS
ncbi:FAD-dependent oxidoreductase [Mycobacterium sp. ITM-2016-00317]|uniref:FAD-dependent oxidoreductase n=1 Tax=Mycobacterium sp. ITM-2016-00317 TaxID=2099694 RepID=UPI00287F81A3|nr:FAD-dependent oxidoreductase [Mycobacterium sp. ITM-2016-00317]WNG85249.1 FAD-dependent oxidoreductase [Mycobacterium sp. ITM-2016-00317]